MEVGVVVPMVKKESVVGKQGSLGGLPEANPSTTCT